jgi:carboxyl-terminal processing protease
MIFPEDQKAGAPTAGKILAAKPFPINDALIADFKGFLQSRKITYDEKAFAEALPDIRYELERECTGAVWGVDESIKISRQQDPVVVKALQVMPEAAKFAEKKWPPAVKH